MGFLSFGVFHEPNRFPDMNMPLVSMQYSSYPNTGFQSIEKSLDCIIQGNIQNRGKKQKKRAAKKHKSSFRGSQLMPVPK